MMKVPGPGNGGLDYLATGDELSVSALFTILWDALADLLGTAATAALLKRAARRAAVRSPELDEVVIQRQGLAYRYTCPARWAATSAGAPTARRAVNAELR